MSSRRRWYLRHYWMLTVVAPVMIFLIAIGQWWIGLSLVAYSMILVVSERGDRWSYRMGYMAGVLNMTEALHRAESGPEFHRLMSTIPEPWEPITGQGLPRHPQGRRS